MRSRATSPITNATILPILEADRSWCAYALADLSAPWSEHATWTVHGSSLLLVYRGLSSPILFGAGEPNELRGLFKELPPGRYWYTLRPTDFWLLQDRVDEFSRTPMWRMRLTEDSYANWTGDLTRLGIEDLESIDRLYAAHSDRPDAYSPDQVEHGVYYGIYSNETLRTVAGTHVVDRQQGVAAVGNVFTAPEHRHRGYGIKATAAVVEHLVELGIETIVLNVEMANQPAIEMYRNLGFMPYCGFYEGIAVLT